MTTQIYENVHKRSNRYCNQATASLTRSHTRTHTQLHVCSIHINVNCSATAALANDTLCFEHLSLCQQSPSVSLSYPANLAHSSRWLLRLQRCIANLLSIQCSFCLPFGVFHIFCPTLFSYFFLAAVPAHPLFFLVFSRLYIFVYVYV